MRRFTPSSIHPPFANYAHGVEVPAGARLIFCSGQLGIGLDKAVPPDVEGQATLCFEALRAILADGGMTMGHLVRINAFVTAREHLKGYMTVRDRFIDATAPASTLMIVSGFARPEFVVEIEAIAARLD